MKWRKESSYHSVSDKGYVVSATRDGKGGWRFTAWGPFDAGWKLRLKVRYEIGEEVPQPHELIGTWDTAAEAVKACNDHLEKKKSVSSRAA